MDHPTACWNCGGSTFHKTMHDTYIRYICVRSHCGKGQSFRVRNARKIVIANDESVARYNPFASSNSGNWNSK